MKIPSAKTGAAEGSVLLVALIITAIAGVTLASYLVLTEAQSVSVVRSQVWNSSMALTEAGIEDGLQLINRFASSIDGRDLPKWTNYVSTDHWETVAPNVYHVQRYLPSVTGTTTISNSYHVWVTNIIDPIRGPTLTAVGSMPLKYLYAQGPQPMFAATTVGTPVDIPRQVVVQTRRYALFAVAMAAVSTIDLKGNNVQSDSFDSADPLYSLPGGFYPTGIPSMTKANGDICSDGVIVNSLNVGNANIKGKVKTGPGTNTMSIGPTGSVGDRAWVESGSKGIKPGWSSTDFNVVFEPPKLPESSTGWLQPSVTDTNINGTQYHYVLTSQNDYTLPGLTDSLLVDAPSNATVNIRITANVSLNGNQVIRIAPTGAKVSIYMEGSTFSLSGGAAIDNQSHHAENFYLFGTETCTYINFGGNSSFYGGIYAPTADFSLGGGGNTYYDFVGGSVTRTVAMNGHFNFHYDENLQRVGPTKGYVPVNWREIAAAPAVASAL